MASGQRRGRAASHRVLRVGLRCSPEEYQALRAAAGHSALTVSGFALEAALAAAHRDTRAPGQEGEALHELIAIRSQLRRYGNNVNQAVRALHSIGQPPPWLLDAIRLTDQAVRRIDQAADRLANPGGGRPRQARHQEDL